MAHRSSWIAVFVATSLIAGRAGAETPARSAASPEVPAPTRGHSAAPWLLTGFGLVLTGAGAGLYVVGANRFADAERRGLTGPVREIPAAVNDAASGRSMQTVGAATMGVGAVAAIGGLVWHFAEPMGPVQVARGHVRSTVLQGPVQVARGHVRSTVLQGPVAQARTVVSPAVTPSFAGLAVHTRF